MLYLSLILILPFLVTILLIYLTIKFIFKSKQKNFVLIKDYEAFSKYINDLNNAKLIGVDTEHFYDNTYKGILCLIQLHISKYNYSIIIDLIVLQNKENDKKKIFKVLKNIFENKNIEKILHSCHNDIKWIYETIDCKVINIFDTQLMNNYIEGNLINNNKNSKNLNFLLKKYLNINFSDEHKKFYQKSNWLNRPLSYEQLIYAANDALYLIDIRNKIVNSINNEKKFIEIKNEYNKQIIEKINEKKDEQFKNIAMNYINDNMTVINEKEYIDLSIKLFIYLLQITDKFASENNINTESLLSVNCIYHICNKLPKTKEKILAIINHYQNVRNNKGTEVVNKKNKFYDDITDCIIEKVNEIEKLISDKNIIENKQSYIDSKKANILKDLKKEAKKKNSLDVYICKRPVYESCKMLAPDGQQLCFCDNKKMTWYISRNLAKMVSEDPPVFQLFFEPNARGCVDENSKSSNFYITLKNNCCVVCGKEENYLRFHVIPMLYRSCFPKNLKSHKSHDVVLLCSSCHEKANKIYEKKKEEISQRYGVPLNIQTEEKTKYLKLQQFKKKCNYLRRKNNPLPDAAKTKLKKELYNSLGMLMNNCEDFKNFIEKNGIKYDKEECIDDNFLKLISEDFKIEKSGEDKKNMHGYLVLQKVKDLKLFIMEWRKFFVDSLNPKFLPDEWSIEHEIVRTFGEYSNFKNEKDVVSSKATKK